MHKSPTYLHGQGPGRSTARCPLIVRGALSDRSLSCRGWCAPAVCVYMSIYTHVCLYVHVYICTYLYICIHIRVQIALCRVAGDAHQVDVCIEVNIHTCVYTYMCAYVHICICIYIYAFRSLPVVSQVMHTSWISIYKYIYAHACIHTYVCIYMYMHVHLYTHFQFALCLVAGDSHQLGVCIYMQYNIYIYAYTFT